MKKTIISLIGFSLLTSTAIAQPAAIVPPPAAVASPVPLAAAAQKVDIQAQIANAVAEYQKKNYGKSAKLFEEITEAIRNEKSLTLEPFLPAAPKGWEAKELRRIEFNIGNNSSARRKYISGSEEITLTIKADSDIDNAMSNLRKPENPMQLMGYRYDFRKGEPDKDYSTTQAHLYVSDFLTIEVSGKNLTDQQAQGFMGLIDIPKLITMAEK